MNAATNVIFDNHESRVKRLVFTQYMEEFVNIWVFVRGQLILYFEIDCSLNHCVYSYDEKTLNYNDKKRSKHT
jgi:hypothetical protein